LAQARAGCDPHGTKDPDPELEKVQEALCSFRPDEQHHALFDYLRVNPTNQFGRLVHRVLSEGMSTEQRHQAVWELARRLLVPSAEDLRRWKDALQALPRTGEDDQEDRILQAATMAALGGPGVGDGPRPHWWGGYYLVAAYLDMHARASIKVASQGGRYLPASLRKRLTALLKPQLRDTTGRPGAPEYERAQVETWALGLAAGLVFYHRCGCGLDRKAGKAHDPDTGPSLCCRADHELARWRPGEVGEPPSVHAWLARYVRGRLAPPRGKPGEHQLGFSPSGLRYSALYASLLQPETGLRIDSVHMRHCPSCDRWLTARDQRCPGHPDHPIGWRLRQHWMFDTHEETLRERFDPRVTVDGTLRLQGVGSDGVVVSGHRLYHCGNRSCDYYVLNPSFPCSVCGTTPPHAATPSSYPPLGPVALDLEPFGMALGGQAPQPASGEEGFGLGLACEQVVRDIATRPAFLRCLARALHDLLASGNTGILAAGPSDEVLKWLANRLPTRLNRVALKDWLRRLLNHLDYRAPGHGEIDREEEAK
jgi:hypothetical protein